MREQRNTQHHIDQLAKNAFMVSIPVEWVANELNPDYELDYLVRVFHDGRENGIQCHVQLKGTSKLRVSESHIYYDFPVKSLAYYNATSKSAVLIVICDVNTGICYFINARDVGNYGGNKKCFRIKIPKTNILSDHDILLSEITKAQQQAINLYANDLDLVVKNEKQRIESLDDRVQCQISYQNGKRHYAIGAKDGHELSFQIRADAEKLQKIIEGGGTVSFNPGEIEAIGSPLFEGASKCGVILKGKAIDLLGKLQLLDERDHLLASIDPIPSCFTGGTKSGCISGALPKNIFKFSFEIPNISTNLGITRRCDVSFFFGGWIGLDLRRMPYFDQMLEFMRAYVDAKKCRIVFEYEGNFLNAAQLTMDFLPHPQLLLWHLEVLAKMRKIRDTLAVPITYLNPPSVDEGRHIDLLHGFLCLPNKAAPCEGYRISFTITLDVVRELERKKELFAPTIVELSVGITNSMFQGVKLDLSQWIMNSALHITGMRLEDPECVRKFLDSEQDPNATINTAYIAQRDSLITYVNRAVSAKDPYGDTINTKK